MNRCLKRQESTHRQSLSQEEEKENSVNNNHRNRSMLIERESLLKSVVKAASICNKILLENCGLCTVYCDKQVQYEEKDWFQQQYEVGTGSMGHLYSRLNTTTDIDTSMNVNTRNTKNDDYHIISDNDNDIEEDSNFICQTPASVNANSERIQVEQYYGESLFNEESVVRSVGSRGGEEDE